MNEIPTTDNTAHQLSHARRLINLFLLREMEKAGLYGFVPSYGDLISQLCRESPMTMTDLAEAIHRDRSTVTFLVKKLVRQGFVSLQENPKDSRSRLVMLTEKGKGLHTEFRVISEKLMSNIYRGINNQEREQFRSTLGQVIHNFEIYEKEQTHEEI
ncbi:MAG: MarR family transcriptional regulator [Anaerolineae bacterium]|nr:MarR family transcriptional regulator [Anaerolineae bacterium]